METKSGKGILFVGLTIIGIVIVLGVYQVPQPWRGVLVAWLLFMGTGGVFILRVVRHLMAYKSLKLETEAQRGQRQASRRAAQPALRRPKRMGSALQVVSERDRQGGQRAV